MVVLGFEIIERIVTSTDFSDSVGRYIFIVQKFTSLI
nr:MAG TPA: hypothetical protein [Caudoviricetes sp.]